VQGHVVEAVAQDGPQELRLRVAALAQQLQPLGGGLLEDAVDQRVGLGAALDVVAPAVVGRRGPAPDSRKVDASPMADNGAFGGSTRKEHEHEQA